MSIFTGSGVAIITPFNEKGINYDEFKKIIDFQLENNTDAILVCGTTGEPPTMSEDEKKEAISFAFPFSIKKGSQTTKSFPFTKSPKLFSAPCPI